MSTISVTETVHDQDQGQILEQFEDFLPWKMVNKLSLHLGPHWEFHVQHELKTRDPGYRLFQDYPQELRKGVTDKITELVSSLISNLVVGEGIMNPDTLQALYNWMPEFLVRDLLREHPEWPVHCITIDGRPCVVNIGKIPNGFPGVVIPHSSTQEREEAYNVSIWKLLGYTDVDKWECGDCVYEKYKSSGAIPPIIKLSRCNAEPRYACCEKFYHSCIKCNRWFASSVCFN